MIPALLHGPGVRDALRLALQIPRVLALLLLRLLLRGEHPGARVSGDIRQGPALPRGFRLHLELLQRGLVVGGVTLVVLADERGEVGRGHDPGPVVGAGDEDPPVGAVAHPLRYDVLALSEHLPLHRPVAHVVGHAAVGLVVRAALTLPAHLAAERSDDEHHHVPRALALDEKDHPLEERGAELGVLPRRRISAGGETDGALELVLLLDVLVVLAVAAFGAQRSLGLGLLVHLPVADLREFITQRRQPGLGELRLRALLLGAAGVALLLVRLHPVREVVDHGDDPTRGVLESRVQDRRVPQALVKVELVVDKAEHRRVKVQKREHDPVVHVLGQRLRERVRGEPGDLLAVHHRLVVDPFDGYEHLAQRVHLGDVRLKLERELARLQQHLGRDPVPLVRGEHGEEVSQSERVVEVAEGVEKGRVPLLHEVVQAVLGLLLLQTVHGVVRLLRPGALDLALVRAEVAEFLEEGLVREEVDVLDVVVGLVLALELLLGLPAAWSGRGWSAVGADWVINRRRAAGRRSDGTRRGFASAGVREMKRGFAYLGWMPLRMHRRRKSASLSCRRLSAWLRVV